MKLKKWVWMLAIALTFVCMSGTVSLAFTDIEENRSSFETIQEFSDRGLTKGYPDGSFRPDQVVSRAEFVAFVNRTFNFEASETAVEFVDINGAEWFFEDLQIAVSQGYIEGYPDGTFRPDKSVTRQEVAVILQRILKYELIAFSSTEEWMEPWAKESIQIMMSNGVIVSRENGFEGNHGMTREEMAVSLISALHIEESQDDGQEASDLPSLGGGSGSGSSGSSDPEYDVTNPPADVEYALHEAVAGLESALDGDTNAAQALDDQQLDIIKDVRDSVESYLADHDYDFESDKAQVRARVNMLSAEEREELKNALQVSIPFEHIGTLQDFFEEN